MSITDLLMAQLTDPFRIGITIALMLTMLRTRHETGTMKPLALGVAFIAVLIPLTIHPGQASLPVAVAMGLNVAFLRVGLDGGIVPVVLAHQMVTLPYAVLIMWAALTRYDPAFERQAMLLGASPQRVVAQVFVPLAASALLVTAAITFVVSWGQYLLTLLPGGGRLLTLPVLVLNAANGGNPTAGATLALIAAIPPALAILLVVRRLTAPNGPGMTRS